MKKVLICLSALFLMAGCDNGTKTLSCKSTNTANGLTTDTKYEVKYGDDDTIDYVTITYHYTQNNTNGTNNTRNATDNTTDDDLDNDTTNDNNDVTDNDNVTRNSDDVDGLNADTDGIDENRDVDANNNRTDADDVVDGIVGDAIDATISGVTDTILDIAGIRNAYENQLSIYDNVEGLTYDVDIDDDNEYRIIYEIDMNKISDADLTRFNVDRDLSTFRSNYEDLGYTCD